MFINMKYKKFAVSRNSKALVTKFQRSNKYDSNLVLYDDVIEKLSAINLLTDKEKRKLEEQHERNCISEKMYEDLYILQTSSHDEKKRNNIIKMIKNLSTINFMHFRNIHNNLIKYDSCEYEANSKNISVICSLYSYIGYKVSLKSFGLIYNGIYTVTVKPK